MTVTALIERRHMAATPAPRSRQPLWRSVAWVLIVVGLYDASGMVAGRPAFFSSPGYFAARQLGIHHLGYALTTIVCTFIYMMGRREATRTQLLVVLLAGFGYNVLWLCLLMYSWFSVGITGWTGPSKAAALAALYMILALRIDERRGS